MLIQSKEDTGVLVLLEALEILKRRKRNSYTAEAQYYMD